MASGIKPPRDAYFWLKADIGEDLRWYLCRIFKGHDGKEMIRYHDPGCRDDFDDYWYDDDDGWEEEDMIVIDTPDD